MADKARHAFGRSEGVDGALQAGVIDAYDILFLDGDTDNPKVGWIDKNGNKVIIEGQSVDLSVLEEEVSKKADAAAVDALIDTATNEILETTSAYVDEKMTNVIKVIEF